MDLCVRDYDALVAKMDELGMDRTEYEFYLDLLNTAQFHTWLVSIERMVTFIAGTKHIREAIPIPLCTYYKHIIKP